MLASRPSRLENWLCHSARSQQASSATAVTGTWNQVPGQHGACWKLDRHRRLPDQLSSSNRGPWNLTLTCGNHSEGDLVSTVKGCSRFQSRGCRCTKGKGKVNRSFARTILRLTNSFFRFVHQLVGLKVQLSCCNHLDGIWNRFQIRLSWLQSCRRNGRNQEKTKLVQRTLLVLFLLFRSCSDATCNCNLAGRIPSRGC